MSWLEKKKAEWEAEGNPEGNPEVKPEVKIEEKPAAPVSKNRAKLLGQHQKAQKQ